MEIRRSKFGDSKVEVWRFEGRSLGLEVKGRGRVVGVLVSAPSALRIRAHAPTGTGIDKWLMGTNSPSQRAERTSPFPHSYMFKRR